MIKVEVKIVSVIIKFGIFGHDKNDLRDIYTKLIFQISYILIVFECIKTGTWIKWFHSLSKTKVI